MNDYVGNPLQLRGGEQYTLRGGKGEGMNFLYVRNGRGLEAWISLDRAGDLSRVSFKGKNLCFFSPCGYVAPQYYDGKGAGFLKSFTAGFVTTCGLTAVGSPCEDDGEELPLHGTVSHIPATLCTLDETDEGLTVVLKLRDAVIFGRKLELRREYFFSYNSDRVVLRDSVKNLGDTVSPYMVMYHCNMGYPLLSENSIVRVPNSEVIARTEEAGEHIDTALVMEEPQAGFEERCYYYDVKEKDGKATVGIFNPDCDLGVTFSYSKAEMPFFTEWKMMGKTDYVLGLEPGNCNPEGRNVMRENGTLRFLEPDEVGTTGVVFSFMDDLKDFESEF